MNSMPPHETVSPTDEGTRPKYERQPMRGARPGDRYVRVLRPLQPGRSSVGPGLFVRRPR